MRPATDRRRSAFRPLAVAVALALALGGLPGAAGADTPELEAARGRLAGARARAAQAAREYLQIQQELGATRDAIDRIEAALPVLTAERDRLRDIVRARAAEAYRGASMSTVVAIEVLDSANLLDAVRMTRLAASANRSTTEVSDQLEVLEDILHDREAELALERVRQEELAADAERRAAELDRALASAAREVRRLEHEAAVATYLTALAQQAAGVEPPPPVAERPPPADPALAALVPVQDLVCPVDGPVTFFDDWGQPRDNWRVHEGTDIFAAHGTPNVAVASGVVKQRVGGLGGNAVWLEADHGVHYYYAHLDRFEGAFDGPERSRRVEQGDVIGYTGNTGNASGGPAHTHFEIHPDGGGAMNPYRVLLVICDEELGNA
jgi:murein DD-endopeptidase MepM/ murein hydrolase activator NlpD